MNAPLAAEDVSGRQLIDRIERAYQAGKENGRREVIDQLVQLLDLDKRIADAISQHEVAWHE